MSRYQNTQLWLDQNGVDSAGDWIALDDDDRDWPPEMRDHFVHAQRTLTNTEVQVALLRSLSERLGPLGKHT